MSEWTPLYAMSSWYWISCSSHCDQLFWSLQPVGLGVFVSPRLYDSSSLKQPVAYIWSNTPVQAYTFSNTPVQAYSQLWLSSDNRNEAAGLGVVAWYLMLAWMLPLVQFVASKTDGCQKSVRLAAKLARWSQQIAPDFCCCIHWLQGAPFFVSFLVY